MLGLLENLAFGHDRGRDHQLDVLELGDVVRAADTKRRLQSPREILGAVESFCANAEAQDDRTLLVLERIK